MKKSVGHGADTAQVQGEPETVVTQVESLGARGDGLARLNSQIIAIPDSLPGEVVRLKLGQQGPISAVRETSSPHRIAPVCPQFGVCGGCTIQHADSETYRAWKKGLIERAASAHRFALPEFDLKSYEDASRRRAALTFDTSQSPVVGFNARRSHETVSAADCAILEPQLRAMVLPLQHVLAATMPKNSRVRLLVTRAENGIDITADGAELPTAASRALIEFAASFGVIRLIWNGATIIEQAKPAVAFGGVTVNLPSGAFLQAMEAAQNDLQSFVTAALAEHNVKGAVADLFAGLGSFSFPSARFCPVDAYEGDAAACSSMQDAIRKATGLKKTTIMRRDLYRNPLSAIELKRYSAIVIDPPREGAIKQFETLAASEVPLIISVSCNPATFARDAALLDAGGYAMQKLTAFDQFKYSEHVEVAATFVKSGGARKGRRRPALK